MEWSFGRKEIVNFIKGFGLEEKDVGLEYDWNGSFTGCAVVIFKS